MSAKYLTLNTFDGSLGGLQANPAGKNDVASPGGMSSIDHHWTHGLFGWPEQVSDVYAGTGDRYIYGSYGNMYTPNAHTDLYADYHGPHTDRTEYRDLHGDPYFWNEGPATQSAYTVADGNIAYNQGQELKHHSRFSNLTGSPQGNSTNNMTTSQGRPVVPRQGVGYIPSNIENFEHSNVETTIEFIEDPLTKPPPPQENKRAATPGKNVTPPSPPKTCGQPPVQPTGGSSTRDNTRVMTVIPQKNAKGNKSNKAVVLMLVMGALVCIDLWGGFIHAFIGQYLNKGKEVTYTRYAIYALAATIAMIVAIQWSGQKVPVCIPSGNV